jgi:hypothetical protein
MRTIGSRSGNSSADEECAQRYVSSYEGGVGDSLRLPEGHRSRNDECDSERRSATGFAYFADFSSITAEDCEKVSGEETRATLNMRPTWGSRWRLSL